MVDNTQVNTGTGDTVRDIDRGAAKTQVVQLDAGGASAESLVSAANPLPVKLGTDVSSVNGLSTNDIPTAAAQTTDAPLSVSIAGDPSGDFAGVNILEKLVDDSGELKMAVRVVNPPKQDAQGAQVASDAPAPIILAGAVGQNIYIDTTGYQSVQVTSPATGGLGGNVQTSNDGVTWSNTAGMPVGTASAQPATQIGAGSNNVFPAAGRWMRFNLTVAGSATAYLRATPAVFLPNVIAPVNLAQINSIGSTATASGATNMLAVGGNVANAAATVIGPINVGGYDSGTPGITPAGGTKGAPAVRQLLTDNTGRLRLAEESPLQSVQNTPSLGVHDIGQFEDQDQYQLLAQILLEMRIQNELMSALPQRLYLAFQALQDAPTSQTSYAGRSWSDEPASFRNDPTYFNQ